MRKIECIVLVLILLLCNTGLMAQEQYKVVGKVCTKDGEALIGADVRENGTGNYTETDVDGKFILYVSSKDAVVKISSIGFKEILLPADYDFSNITIYKYYKDRRWHMNLYASQSTLIPINKEIKNLKSSYGGGISIGNSFLFKRKPGYKTTKYGIIVDYVNLNSSIYNLRWGENDDDSDYIQESSIGIQVGPTMIISPLPNLNIQMSAKYALSYSAIVFETIYESSDSDDITNGYAFCIEISYGAIGIGVDYRIQSAQYNIEDHNYISENNNKKPLSYRMGINNGKLKSNTLRAYLSIKF